MNLTFKIVLDKRYTKSDKTNPLKLRLYSGTQYKEKSIDIFIPPDHWDEQNQLVNQLNDDADTMNTNILTVKKKVKRLLLLSELNEEQPKPEDIIAQALNIQQQPQKAPKHCIIKYGREQIEKLTKSGKAGNAFVYSCAVNKLQSYLKTNTFPFEELTFKKLTDFSNAMLAEDIKVNTISVYMRTIRAIYNKAIKEGLVPSTAYPFAAYRIKNEKTINRALTLQELQAIANYRLEPGSSAWHWRNYFLLSFCLIGINFADMLTLTGSNIIDGRIVFRRRKTAKVYSIKLSKRATEILSYYCDLNTIGQQVLLLPVLKQMHDPVKLKKDIWQAIKTCNSYLRKLAKDCNIGKDITTYYARYSFAGIARSLGYTKDMIAEALGHEYGNRVTGIYLDNYENEVIDGMMEKVTAAVLPLVEE